MDVLVCHHAERRALRDHAVLRHARVVGLVMLEAEVLDAIAEREQEVVVVVVARAEHRVRFLHETLPLLRELRRRVERRGAVGHQVHFDRPAARHVERHLAEILARDRRIDERGQRYRISDPPAGPATGAGAELPAVGQLRLRGTSHHRCARPQIQQHLVGSRCRVRRLRRGRNEPPVRCGEEVERPRATRP